MQKLAGLLLVIGSAVALFGESRPSIFEVYGTTDLAVQLSAIAADPGGWAAANWLMAIGGIIVGVGLVLFAAQVQRMAADSTTRTLAYIGAGAVLVGALGNTLARYSIINDWEAFVTREGFSITMLWPFLFVSGLIISGFVLLRAGYPKWLAWAVIVVNALLLVGLLIMGGLPPALFYFAVLAMGLMLLIKSVPQPLPRADAQSIASA